MTRALRLLPVLCATLLLAAPAAARTDAVAVGAPTGLHPFLLRVDEPRGDSFSRTPAFAWNPVSGALRYEFQLSTSNTFRDNGIVYSDTSLTSPVASPALTLPWITGSPHSLFARVRAVLADTTTHWSDSFGFDMEPAAVPAPIATYPGLLRWTPTDGATGYQVWFVDLPKMIVTTTNVADLREFYSFHQAASWLSQVRWRIRALRFDYNGRANGLPAVGYGAWSPVYVSVNPPFAVGPLTTTATVSDIVSTGARTSPAHRLTPAFVYGGNRSPAGIASELYRVHVYTDRGCVNRVYAGAIVGSPAYAPRYTGPLALPSTGAALTGARSVYLPDGAESSGVTADSGAVVANESLPPVTPTLGLPGGAVAPPAAAPGAPAAPAAPATPAPPASAPAGGTIELIKATGPFGPPVSIWDTDWSRGSGYYWTVVPIEAKVPGAGSSSVAGSGAAVGALVLPVANANGFAIGDAIAVGNAGNQEPAVITSVTAGSLGLAAALKLAHGAGEPVVRTSGNIVYQETELGQDACASGRVLRFGKESEPALTSGGEPFVSGLSPTGKLRSATGRAEFYGSPLAAWTTALGADVYAVQWSKQRHPFTPQTDPASGALGMMTLNTSVVLPLAPGTWYYRVRGYDFSLPTGAQAMSWSDTQQVVATKPTFAVVRGGTVKTRATKEVRVPSGGFSVRVPASWSSGGRSTASASGQPKLTALGVNGAALRLVLRDGRGYALFVQTKADGSTYSHAAWARKAAASMRHTRGRAGSVRCVNVSLPAGAAVRCALSTRVAGGTQSAVVYLLRHRSATYTLTFASTRPGAAGEARAGAAAARSFRFTS